MTKDIAVLEDLVVKGDDGQPRTTSLIVAERFGKEHRNVLRDIRELAIPDDFRRLNFEQSDYINEQSRSQPMYLMTEDGFSLLVMGFTGKEAMAWKIRFIEAFRAMRDALAHGQGQTMALLDQLTRTLVGVHDESMRALALASPVPQLVDNVSKLHTKVDRIDDRVERISDAFERLRPALQRKDFSEGTKQQYRLVVVRFYRGLCPCCQNNEVVSGSGVVLPTARYDHWSERNRNWSTDGWLVCHPCNQMLETQRHKHTGQFTLFQQRLEQLSGAAEQLTIRNL